MKYILITNNSLVAQNINKLAQNNAELIYNEQYSFLDVLEQARNYIHKGHILLTHPLSGSVKPYETPFKSVIISLYSDELDMNSLDIIENTIETAKKFLKDYQKRECSNQIYDDFRLIDYSLVKGAIEQMHNDVVQRRKYV